MNRKAGRYALLCLVMVFPPLVLAAVIRQTSTGLLTWIGTGIFIPSYALWMVAYLQMGKPMNVLPQTDRFVTNGLYSRIRHPPYVFGQLAYLAVVLCTKSVSQCVVWLLILLLQRGQARKEERLLEEKFGTAYAEYKKRTWF